MSIEQNRELSKWTEIKNRLLREKPKVLYFQERELWWAYLGLNVGQEQDGKNEGFERPVLVLKKFYRGELLWAVPLTTVIKFGDYYVELGIGEAKASWAILPQLRALSRKRLIRKIRTVSRDEYDRVKDRLEILLQK